MNLPFSTARGNATLLGTGHLNKQQPPVEAGGRVYRVITGDISEFISLILFIGK
jgi:hypothetical protein